MQEYIVGQKIEYRTFTKSGKAVWSVGIVHGVRRYEDAATGAITGITYVIDTGRDVRVDEYAFDYRDREVSKRMTKLVGEGVDPIKAFKAIEKEPDLPASKIGVDRVRQPEQIEVAPEHIRGD